MPGPVRSAALDAAMKQLQAKISAPDYAIYDKALTDSPSLTERLNDQVGKSITAFDYKTGDGAYFQPNASGAGPIIITSKFLTDLKAQPVTTTNDLIFILGHETSHGQNAASVKAADQALMAGATGPNATVITKKSKSYNATAFVAGYARGRLQDEALGNIRGWNDVVSAEVNRLGVKALTDAQLQTLVENSRYGSFFLDARGAYKTGYSAGTLGNGMVDPAAATNLNKAIEEQGRRTPSTVEGVTYTQYYAAAALDLAAKQANGRPVIVDFAANGLLKDTAGAAITVEQAVGKLRTAGMDGAGSANLVLQDSASATKYTLTKTKTGVQLSKTGADGKEVVLPNAALPVNVVAEPDKPTVLEKWVEELGEVRSITGGQIGTILGSTLGRQIAGSDPFVQMAAGSVLGALGQALGRSIDAGLGEGSLAKALSTELNNLPTAVRDIGIGAISSALVAEFSSAIGSSGDVAGVFNATAGTYVAAIAANIVRDGFAAAFQNLGSINPVAIVGAYFGTRLAMKIGNFETVGGQIGASIGSSIGSIILPGPIGAFIGTLAGGLIGSLFGGTPRAGADVLWDAEAKQFEPGNSYARKGGSRSAAIAMATTVADAFNSAMKATGGVLVDPSRVVVGNYGTRKSDFVYRPTSTTDTDAITARFTGRNAAVDLMTFGVHQGLKGLSGQIAGGDVYAKRALLATSLLAQRGPNQVGSANGGTFDLPTLAGNLQVGADYSGYLLNAAAIEALIAADPDSSLTASWVVTLARALELGLNKRAVTDWIGGFVAWLDERNDGVVDGVALAPSTILPMFDARLGERLWITTEEGTFAVFGDTIAVADKTIVQGTAANDVITVTGDTISAPVGMTIAGNVQDIGAAAYRISVAAVIDGGQGDDTIVAGDLGNDVLGGIGNDTLVGGKLDDWLIGGDGNDRLFAGAVAVTAFADTATASINAALAADGGSGNFLGGGAGDDRIFGSTGSDWLAGGDGLDQLHGGAGGDILDVGKGNEGTTAAPAVRGGAGSDQYVFNRGDGQDVYFDEAGTAGPGGLTGDSISAAVRARTANTLAKNWAGGGEFTVDGSTKGGEDAITFGAGITMFHLLLERSGTAQSPGMDLIIKIQRTDGTWAVGDDQITIKDWFEGTRRIEWLRFANGEELRLGDFTSFQKGTAGADVIIGTAGNDFQYGDDGDDNMWGLTGNDWQVGGRGNDAVRGNDDNDVVLGGEDDDIVLGGLGNDTASGDDGKDSVYGGQGNDLVVGGRGDDEVAGGAGDDIIKYNRGDGRDTLYDEFAGTWELVWRDGAYTNGYTLDGNGRVTKGGITYNDGTTWLGRYDYNEQGGLKSLYRLVPATGAAAVNSGTDVLEFGTGVDIQDLVFRQDGQDLRIAVTRSGGAIDVFDEVTDQIRIKDWYAASPNGKSIEKLQFVNTGEHLISAMTLVGGTDGADTLIAVAGTPAWITGGAGDDTVTGTALADVLAGNSGADALNGAAGVDVLYGGDGDDLLTGGAGADVLIGGTGSDTASYAGSAALTVFLDAAQGTSTGDAAGDTFNAVENLTGSASADTLYGDAGGNVMDGGAGGDALYGGAGDDIYQLYTGSGTDMIADRVMSGVTVVAGAAGDDMIELGEGLSFSNIALARIGNDLTITITIGTGADKLTVKDHFTTADAAIETIVTADGAAAPLAGVLLASAGTATGAAAAELLFGRANANDTLDGGAGDDVLSGSSGDDILRGGDGNDVLEGGIGADTLDGGLDTISSGGVASAAGNGDIARYAGSSAAVSVNLATRAVSGGDAQGDVIIASGAVSTIENITGSAFADTLTGDARANMLVGLAGNDALAGGAGDDVLIGGDGIDAITGGDGADNIDAGEGDDASVRGDAGNDLIAGGGGNDTLYGDVGLDTLDGGLGNDALWGGADADTLGGGDGTDTLQGEAGDDKLAGGAGNDTLVGGDGADTLSGDAGDDALQGGLGDDTYAFDGNAGTDSIVDASGVNRIAIAGVAKEQVWLTRLGNDLKIGVIGGTTRLTVTNYFATTGATLMREIAVGDASIFLKYARPLIGAMTAASVTPPASVASISAAVATQRDVLWWAGGKAAPSAADFAVSAVEDIMKAGTLAVVDHDENVNAYAVVTQAVNGTVAVNAATGAWSYTPKANYAGADSFVLSAKDADGQMAQARATVTIAPVNDPPKFGATPVLAVDENAANGTAIATFTATDAEGQPVTFRLNGISPFAISSTGALTVLDGSKLNFEAAASAIVNVVASDGQDTAQAFTVTIRNVAEAPDAPGISGTPVARVSEPGVEGAPAIAGTTIASFTLTDPDGTTPTLRIRAAPAAIFATTGNALTFATNYAPNFDTVAVGQPLIDRDGDGLREIEYSADVEAWDGGKPSLLATRVTVGIEDTNEAPTAIGFTSPTVTERDRPSRAAPPTSPVSLGFLSVTDVDLVAAGESHVYSVADTRFEIVNVNELRLKANQAFDYESALIEGGTGKRYVDVAITVKDRGGTHTATKTLIQTKRIYISDADDYLYGTAGNDNGAAALIGQAGRDIIEGMDGNDEIYGQAGNDSLYGGNGGDTLRGGTGGDTYYGGEGGDSITDEAGEAITDEAYGDAGDDIISLGGGDDRLYGGTGNDQLYGGTGADLLEGGDGVDLLFGDNDADTLRGGAGDDRLAGGLGADRLEGGLNFDLADYGYDTAAVRVDLDAPSANTGAAAGDVYVDIEGVLGSTHADTLLGRAASNDHLDGGAGNDDVQGRGGDDGLLGGLGDDRVQGGAGNDMLFGDTNIASGQDGADIIEGGDGNDHLYGHGGADTLRGDAGFDRLDGGSGDDLLIGGAGSDTYVIRRGDGNDRIEQTGAQTGDRDLLGFTDGLTNRNLWFEWTAGDVTVSVLGTSAVSNTVRLLGYSALGRSNVESVIAADQQLKTKDLAIGLLATTMDRFVAALGYRPVSQAQFDALYSNTTTKIDGLTFRQHWDNFWSANEAPTLAILNAAGWNTGWSEDQYNTAPYTIQVRLADDQGQVPNLTFQVDEVAFEGSTTIDPRVFQSLGVTRPTDDGGVGSIAVRTRANASGTRWLWIRIADAGGLTSERWVPVTIAAVADVPSVSRADSPGGNAGAWIPVIVDAAATDVEANVGGAEGIVVIGVHRLPAELQFNKGYRRGDGVWILSHGELSGLHVLAPAGWSKDLTGADALVFDVWSQEPSNAASAVTSVAVGVRINAAPAAPVLTNATIAENQPANSVVGQLVVNDPDLLETNPFDWNRSSIWWDESRWLDTTGPMGGTVRALQTGQFNTENGGGVHSNGFYIDPAKAYKFTVFVRPDGTADTRLYFGVAGGGFVENAANGADYADPYFMHPLQNELTAGRWYRLEGYVLPQGAALVDPSSYGGVYDVATGAKVQNALNVFRWNDAMPGTLIHNRFFNYHGSAQGYSASWYQPVVEQLPAFTLTGGSGVSVDTAGVVRLAASANYEAQASYPFSVTAMDAGGLASAISTAVTIANVNEAPYITGGAGWKFFTELGSGSAAADAVVATIGIADPDANSNLSLEIMEHSDYEEMFYIDQATRTIRFRPGTDFSYEALMATGRYGTHDFSGNTVTEAHIANLYVRVSDGSLASDTIAIHVSVEDVPETPEGLHADRYLNVNEDAGYHGFAWMRASDPDGQTLTYTIADGVDGGGRFALRSDGELIANGGYDYESTTGYTVRIRATDPTNRSTTGDFWVAINNVNERPNNLALEAQNFFPETQGGASHEGQLIARFAMTDTDGPAPGLVLLSNPNGWFTTAHGNHLAFTGANFTTDWLHANMGQHGLEGGYWHDRDGDGAYEVKVATVRLAAQDAGGLPSDPFDYEVFIEDANEAPTLYGTSFWVPENAPGAGNTPIGTLGWSDPDASPKYRTPTFAITWGNDDNAFSINPQTGTISLQGALNFEARTAHTLGVSMTDAAGASSATSVNVYVTDVNEAPQPYVTYGDWRQYNTVYHLAPNDPDDAAGFVVTNVWSDNGSWAVSGNYNSSTNRIVVNISDHLAPWGGHSYGTVWVTVADKYGSGVSTTVSFDTHVDGYRPRPGEREPPVVLDLDGDGVELIPLARSEVRFDMDGDGKGDRTGWVGADDGLLVLDKNGNGIIDEANEFSFATDLEGARSDLQGLRAYDSDKDGYFEKDDADFARFQIWQDKNQDGVSQADELRSFAERDITGIRLELDETGAAVEGATDNVVFATSEAYRNNGATLDVADVFLAYRSSLNAQNSLGSGKLNGAFASSREMVAELEGPEGKIAFSGIDPNQPLHDRLKVRKPLVEPVKNDAAEPLTAPAPTVKPTAPTGRGASANSQPVATLGAGTAAIEPAAQPEGVRPRPVAQQTAATKPNLGPAARSIQTSAEAGAPMVRTEAAPSAAVRAAAILRSGQSGSLSAFNTGALGVSDRRVVLVTRADDMRVDHLIAAMAAFQGGGGIGTGELPAAAPIDHLLAQLAPAV